MLENGLDDKAIEQRIKFPLQRKAKSQGWRWRNYRLLAADFESAFWLETYHVLENFGWRGAYGQYLVYETLLLAWDRRAKDVAKQATRTEKGIVFHTALPLSDYFAEVTPDTGVNVEEQVINKMMLEEFMRDALKPSF